MNTDLWETLVSLCHNEISLQDAYCKIESMYRHSEWKAGDVVRITRCVKGHGFNLGEVVTVVEFDKNSEGWLCTNGQEYWWLDESEAELVTTNE
jgi:hypothetical protein